MHLVATNIANWILVPTKKKNTLQKNIIIKKSCAGNLANLTHEYMWPVLIV